MSKYRDDQDGLRDRVHQLEAELAALREELASKNAELTGKDIELAQRPAAGSSGLNGGVILSVMLVAFAGIAGAVVFLNRSPRPAIRSDSDASVATTASTLPTVAPSIVRAPTIPITPGPTSAATLHLRFGGKAYGIEGTDQVKQYDPCEVLLDATPLPDGGADVAELIVNCNGWQLHRKTAPFAPVRPNGTHAKLEPAEGVPGAWNLLFTNTGDWESDPRENVTIDTKSNLADVYWRGGRNVEVHIRIDGPGTPRATR